MTISTDKKVCFCGYLFFCDCQSTFAKIIARIDFFLVSGRRIFAFCEMTIAELILSHTHTTTTTSWATLAAPLLSRPLLCRGAVL